VPLKTACSIKWQIPLSSAVSWREPRRTQMPAVTDRSPGMCSVRTTIPFGIFVDCTSSIICWNSNSALKAPWVNGVRNPSTSGAEAVAGGGLWSKTTKNAAKWPYLHRPLLDSTVTVNDNNSPVVLPVRLPGTLVVSGGLNS
jgi:hypothetical protein